MTDLQITLLLLPFALVDAYFSIRARWGNGVRLETFLPGYGFYYFLASRKGNQ